MTESASSGNVHMESSPMKDAGDPYYVISTIQGAIPFIPLPDSPVYNAPRLIYLDDFLYKDSFYEALAGGSTGALAPNASDSVSDHSGTGYPIAAFIGTTQEVIVAFRGKEAVRKRENMRNSGENMCNSESVAKNEANCNSKDTPGGEIGNKKPKFRLLRSKRGNYKLTEDRYNETIKKMSAKNCADFFTGEVKYNDFCVIDPETLEEFNEKFSKGRAENQPQDTQPPGNQPRNRLLFGTSFLNNLSKEGRILTVNSGDGSLFGSVHINDTEEEYTKYLYSINEINAFSFIAGKNYEIFGRYFGRDARRN